jgi:hypothetical protein
MQRVFVNLKIENEFLDKLYVPIYVLRVNDKDYRFFSALAEEESEDAEYIQGTRSRSES